MQKRIRLTENSLHRIIKETVKKILKEEEESPYLSDKDIHKQYENFEINDFRIAPKQFRSGGYGWEVSFEISFPNVDHPDFDETKWENVDVWDEEGKRITLDGWYPEDIIEQLLSMIRSEIQKHKSEMESLKEKAKKEEEEHQNRNEQMFNDYKKRKGISNETLNRKINRIVSETLRRNLR